MSHWVFCVYYSHVEFAYCIGIDAPFVHTLLLMFNNASPASGPRRRPFEPDPNSYCLCGSGARFKNCCKGRLPGFGKDQKWRKAAVEKRWSEMIRHLRADVTQYTIWHLTTTAPAIVHQPNLKDGWLMNIDIEALSELVDNLMWGYARKGWLNRLSDVLDRLKVNIQDPRWQAKIAYHRSVCALWRNDRDLAKREFASIQPITTDCSDVDLLQLYVDLYGTDIGMMERLRFFDRIRELSKSVSDKLQYGGARAFELLLHGDEQGALSAFNTVIQLGREFEAEKPFSPRAESWFCKTLEGQAIVARDQALFAEIDMRITKLINLQDEWTPGGRAQLLRSLGDCRRYGGVFTAAIATYQESDKLVSAPELRTFQAECELHLGNLDEAYRLIRTVPVDELDLPERADHAFTNFYIAIARGDKRSLLDARDLLTSVTTKQPYFETRRLQHIVTIGEALEAIQNKAPLPEVNPLISGLQRLSRYALLQPNLAGIGLNANVMIDDFISYAEERAKRSQESVPTYPKRAK
jgi:tetratricopeptide (TPR) repeat protein